MAYETLVGGMQLVIPTSGTKNWGTIVRNSTWVKINTHQHTGAGDGNPLTSASFVNNSITGLQLSKNLNLTEAALVTVAANAATIDWNNGNKASLDLSAATGAVALTLSNPIAGASYRMTVTQDVTVDAITWPAAVKWPGGEEPTQFMSASSKNVIIFDYDGTDYIGSWELNLS